MKIAVILSGRINKWSDCIDVLKKNFMNIYDTDVFLSLDLESETQDIRDFKAQFNVVNSYYEKYTKYLKDIPFKSEETSERKSLSMFYHNFKAMEMILEHIKTTNTIYDVVVKFRADILSEDLFLIQFNVMPNTYYFPHGWCYRGINDQIAYGDIQSMTYYCSLYHYIIKYVYVDKQIFNPEFLLMYHINLVNANIIRFPYKYKLHPDRMKQDTYVPQIEKINLMNALN